MTLDDRLAAFVCGLHAGLAFRCHLDTTQAEHEAAHADVKPIVDAMVAEMNCREHDRAHLREQLRARQIEGCERFKAKAYRWPPEAGELG